MQLIKAFIKSFFFGNYFYGICAVALSIEAGVQQYYPLNPLPYYIFLFAATVLYYTRAYITETTADFNNKRSVWYLTNKRFVWWSQVVLTVILFVCLYILWKDVWKDVLHIPMIQWVIFFIFPLVAALYYGVAIPVLSKYNLRNTGWIKPFVIGFVWGGAVTIYPILFHTVETGTPFGITLFGVLLFIKNFMYITVLCIMFDIKDYAADHNRQLKTFVVRVGLRKTIFYIMIPLCTIGFGTFLVFTISHHFPLMRIMVNAIPFILLITVAYSMHRRKNILYYLAIIDGLMLVKAACGILSMTLIK